MALCVLCGVSNIAGSAMEIPGCYNLCYHLPSDHCLQGVCRCPMNDDSACRTTCYSVLQGLFFRLVCQVVIGNMVMQQHCKGYKGS